MEWPVQEADKNMQCSYQTKRSRTLWKVGRSRHKLHAVFACGLKEKFCDPDIGGRGSHDCSVLQAVLQQNRSKQVVFECRDSNDGRQPCLLQTKVP